MLPLGRGADVGRPVASHRSISRMKALKCLAGATLAFLDKK